jgi:hypothetical protein
VQLALGEAGAGAEQQREVGRGAEGEELPEARSVLRDLEDGGGEDARAATPASRRRGEGATWVTVACMDLG